MTDKQPHIILVVADGVGYADVGYSAGGPPTPAIDALSDRGVRFTRHYVQSSPAPSRAALLTGRYAANTGITSDLPLGSPAGLPDDVPTLPETLQNLGYSTAMAGTWGLGHSQWKLTPTGKGFQEFVGSFAPGADWLSKAHYDMPWRESGLDWVHAHANGTRAHTLEARPAVQATAAEAQRMISQHVETARAQEEARAQGVESARADAGQGVKPLFLFVSFSAAAQAGAGEAEAEECSHIPHAWRRRHCAAMVRIDAGLKAITDTATAALGDNMVLVVSSTSAGSPWDGGLNSPYRGGAGSTLEGGLRVPAFAVDFTEDGRHFGAGGWSYNGPTHISDWFPTFISLARGSLVRYAHSGGDGSDMTVTLRYYRNRRPHREDTLLELHSGEDARFDRDSVAMVAREMKLIEGRVRDTSTYLEPSSFNLKVSAADSRWSIFFVEKFLQALEGVGGGPSRVAALKKVLLERLVQSQGSSASAAEAEARGGGAVSLYLYNVTGDPREMSNIALSHPDVVAVLQEKVRRINRARKLPQQQCHMHYDVSQTLTAGDCAVDPGRDRSHCRFTSPWVRDDADPWDAVLTSSFDSDDRRLKEFGAALGVIVFITILTLLFCCRRKTPPKPKVIERPKQ
jgi:arylsulfatase A-like enzyme